MSQTQVLEIVEIPTDKIKPSPYQPRLDFDLEELRGSIIRYGIRDPLKVRKVGDSWEIPFDVPEVGLEGKISFVVTELGKVDVPAGTYDVFKIGVESSGFNIEAEGVQADLEMNGVLSLEKDTCRLVDLDLALTLETVIEDQTGSIDMNFEMTLIEHLK